MQDHPAPPDPENTALREALQSDAEQVPEAPFHAGLHYATMRRVRALVQRPARGGPKLAWLGAIPSAALLTFAVIELRSPRPLPSEVALTPRYIERRFSELQGSSWAYELAATQGDDTLYTALDHDAHHFLPPSSALFSSPNLN